MAGLALAKVTIPDPLGGASFSQVILKIAAGVGELIATVGGIMILISGFMYLLAGGSPEKVNVAKKTLIYAIAGMVVGLGADAIIGEVQKIVK